MSLQYLVKSYELLRELEIWIAALKCALFIGF